MRTKKIIAEPSRGLTLELAFAYKSELQSSFNEKKRRNDVDLGHLGKRLAGTCNSFEAVSGKSYTAPRSIQKSLPALCGCRQPKSCVLSEARDGKEDALFQTRRSGAQLGRS